MWIVEAVDVFEDGHLSAAARLVEHGTHQLKKQTPPFPGTQEKPVLLVAMPHITLHQASYFDLKPDQAVTFSAANPVRAATLPAGQKLYRVFGGQIAKAKGAFWAPEPPAKDATEGDWRSLNAVEPIWNAGTHVAEMTIQEDCTLQTWFGEIGSQPARSEKGIIKDWWLVGGGQQYFLQSWTPAFDDAVTIKTLGNTPWSDAFLHKTTMPKTEIAINFTPSEGNLAVGAHAHVSVLSNLTDALRLVAKSADDMDAASTMAEAANTVASFANILLADVEQDPKAVEAAIRANLHLGRHIEIDPTLAHASKAIEALQTVIHHAATISHHPKRNATTT